MVFASLECRTTCSRCGQPVMINGPALRILCNSCQSELEIDHVTWKSVFEKVRDTVRGLKEGASCQMQIWSGTEFSITITRTAPTCPSCSRGSLEPEGAGGDTLTCSACGGKTPAAKPPAWLGRMYPEIACLVNAREEEPGGRREIPTGKPVLFSCPSCGGSLPVNGSDRMIECTYCKSSIYLPDDLWLRIHPARTVQAWHIGLDDAGWGQDVRNLNEKLLAAVMEHDEEAAAEAIERGADPDCADEAGKTALFLAAALDLRKVVRILCGRKADLERRDQAGTTPLNIAAYNGNLEIVEYLAGRGADINTRNNEGLTPLYGPAKNGHEEVVQFLLKAGTDPSIPNEDGVTPLEKAQEGGHRRIVSLLKKHSR